MAGADALQATGARTEALARSGRAHRLVDPMPEHFRTQATTRGCNHAPRRARTEALRHRCGRAVHRAGDAPRLGTNARSKRTNRSEEHTSELKTLMRRS